MNNRSTRRALRRVAVLAVLCFCLFAREAKAIETDVWINPGFKLAYTIGGGFTYGLELSVVWVGSTWDDLKELPVGLGGVLTLDWCRGVFKAHLGAEVVGPWVGVVLGPSLVRDRRARTNHFGIGFTPWISSYLIPYYTYTYVFNRPANLHELGALFKLHINTDGDFGSSGDWDDD
jgi:hypothetical protein